jgi:drug/metabolite transporter (DMT)-like permease
MFLSVFSVISLRFLSGVNSTLVAWIMSLSTLLMGLTLTLSMEGFLIPENNIGENISAILGLMLCTLIGQYSLIWALKYEEASLVSAIRCSEVMFGFLWQTTVGTYPDAYRWIVQ